jgi:glycine betaine/choline ABC-type transport system substrate-binding protein
MWKSLAAIAALALTLALAACGSGGESTTSGSSGSTASAQKEGSIFFNPENVNVALTIGSQNFPEQEILGEIYAQALTAAGYRVKTALDLESDRAALKALKREQISAFPEYISTALTSFFGFKPEEVPSGAKTAKETANVEFLESGLQSFAPTLFARANAVGTTKEIAEKYDLKTISDLKGVSKKLSLYGPPDCRQQIDCLAGLEKLYGLKFKSFTPVGTGLRYTVLEKGQADLSILPTTDPQLSAESDKFVILEDDKHAFPAGNVIFVHQRKTAWEAGSGLELTVQAVQEGLTLKEMQELNARVELEGETPEEVAASYLESGGYVFRQ